MKRTVIALLLLVGGAAVAVAQTAPAKPSQPKPAAKQAAARPAPQTGPCVGVVSDLGAKFTVRKVGLTVFGNADDEVPADSWRIDDLVAAKIGGVFGKRAIVKRVPYHKEAFASLEEIKLFRDTDAEIGDGIRSLAAAAGTHCAAYLLVTRAYYNLGDTNQRIGGIGVLHTGVGDLFTKVNAYALFAVRLYDGETFKLVKRVNAKNGDSIFTQWIHGPYRQLDESAWPDPPANAMQNAKLRETIRDLVAQGMDTTLKELPLITE
jgi:hypothetical protein